eukprot:gene17585-biopygen8340
MSAGSKVGAGHGGLSAAHVPQSTTLAGNLSCCQGCRICEVAEIDRLGIFGNHWEFRGKAWMYTPCPRHSPPHWRGHPPIWPMPPPGTGGGITELEWLELTGARTLRRRPEHLSHWATPPCQCCPPCWPAAFFDSSAARGDLRVLFLNNAVLFEREK